MIKRRWGLWAALLSGSLIASGVWAWTPPSGDVNGPEKAGDEAVPNVGGSDEEASEKPLVGLPQPKPRPFAQPSENLEDELEVEFVKPYRRVRGKERALEVTVRVKNATDKPVKGPIFLQITGSTFTDFEVLGAKALATNGDPMFVVVEDGKSLSHRSRRGRSLEIRFRHAESEPQDDDAETPSPKTKDEDAKDDSEIDWRLTRKGLELAEPLEVAKLPPGRGRGYENRRLPIPRRDPDLVRAMEASDREAQDIFKVKGVIGKMTTINDDNDIVHRILVKRLGVKDDLPDEIDGVPVDVEVSWTIRPLYDLDDPTNRAQGGAPVQRLPPGECPTLPNCPTNSDLTSFFEEIPIGAQINNDLDRTATTVTVGTYGFYVQDQSRPDEQFLLSNNHVIARESTSSGPAQKGEILNQPLPFQRFATLERFVGIDLRNLANGGANLVDGAVGVVDSDGRPILFVTPCNGYGAVGNRAIEAEIGDTVAKCGRTTGCTEGTVIAIDTDINVGFAGGVAGFVNQISIVGNGVQFAAGGDSGSGIVNTLEGFNLPTGLLFAGQNGSGIGNITFANQIGDVLPALSVSIVGVPPGCPNTVIPAP